jgi:hypothetical protein
MHFANPVSPQDARRAQRPRGPPPLSDFCFVVVAVRLSIPSGGLQPRATGGSSQWPALDLRHCQCHPTTVPHLGNRVCDDPHSVGSVRYRFSRRERLLVESPVDLQGKVVVGRSPGSAAPCRPGRWAGPADGSSPPWDRVAAMTPRAQGLIAQGAAFARSLSPNPASAGP